MFIEILQKWGIFENQCNINEMCKRVNSSYFYSKKVDMLNKAKLFIQTYFE